MEIYVEDWVATYGSPYLVAPDDQALPEVELMEDGDGFRVHQSEVRRGRHQPLAFVDGVRRGEAALYQIDAASGQVTRGVAGSHACGAVIADGERRAIFTHPEIQRMAIWGSGHLADAPPGWGGWRAPELPGGPGRGGWSPGWQVSAPEMRACPGATRARPRTCSQLALSRSGCDTSSEIRDSRSARSERPSSRWPRRCRCEHA